MIIRRAFVREVLHTTGAVLAILLSIFMVVRVVGILQDAVEGDAPLESVFTLLLLKVIANVDIIVPLVLYVAVLLVQNRWNRDNEMIVLQACGSSIGLFIKPTIILVLVVGFITGLFSLYLAPLSGQISSTIEETFRNRSDIAGVVPGVFTETKSGQGVYFVESFNEEAQQYRDVFVYNGGARDGVVVANNGFKTVDQLSGDEFLVLKDGTRYEGNPGDSDYGVINFETYALRLKENAVIDFKLPVKAIPTTELVQATHRTAVGELHWRIAHVLAVPIMIIMALSFSSSGYRRTRLPGMLTALLTYFAYINALGFGVAMIRKGQLDAHWGLYMIHLAFAMIAAYRFQRKKQDMSLIPGVRRRA